MTKEERLKRRVAARHRSYRRTWSGRLSRMAERANARAKLHGIPGRVTTGELQELLLEQGGRCALTGRSLTADKPNALSHASLDHIVGVNCRSGITTGSKENLMLVRLNSNKMKGNMPLPSLFGETKPVLTEYMSEFMPVERQRQILELQAQQLRALGRQVTSDDYVVVKNLRRSAKRKAK